MKASPHGQSDCLEGPIRAPRDLHFDHKRAQGGSDIGRPCKVEIEFRQADDDAALLARHDAVPPLWPSRADTARRCFLV